MYEETDDDDEKFYKNILILQTKLRVHKEVQNKTTMDRKTYLQARKKAAKKAKDDINNRIADFNNGNNNGVV